MDDRKVKPTVDQHIVPGYRRLAVSTQQMRSQTQVFCAAPAKQTLQQLRVAFNNAMDDWQSIQHIRFGPIEFLLRGPGFQLWPDKRGSVGKHLLRLIANAAPSALEPERFARGSVAVQGFGALERLLFDKQAAVTSFDLSDSGRYRCALAQAIADNLARMAVNLANDWTQGEEAHRRYFASSGNGNDYYENTREVASRLLNNLHAQLQFLVEQKLDRPLGSSAEKANGRRAESWRSGRSLRNIRYNLLGLKALHQTAFAGQIGDQQLAQAITNRFDRALKRLQQIPVPPRQAVNYPTARKTVLALRQPISELQTMYAGPVPEEFELSLGFNSLDGD